MASFNPGEILNVNLRFRGQKDICARMIRIIERLGSGGMAEVYQVEVDGMNLAMKLALEDMLSGKSGESNRRRFEGESEVLEQISGHENIVSLVASGTAADQRPFYLAEYVHGRTLSELLLDAAHANGRTVEYDRGIRALGLSDIAGGRKFQGTAMDLYHVRELMRGILRALIHSHAHGVVHRDLKPDNVMVILSDDGKMVTGVKILDFGIAKSTEGETQHTLTGTILGTPEYITPEQVISTKQADYRADLFAAGLILLAMLTGLRMLGTEDTGCQAILLRRATTEPVDGTFDPSRYIEQCPEGLRVAVLKATSLRPEDRYQSAEEMLEALEEAFEGRISKTDLPFAATVRQAYLPAMVQKAVTIARQSIAEVPVMAKRAAVKTAFWTKKIVIASMLLTVFATAAAVIGYFAYASSDRELFDRTTKVVETRVEAIATSLQSVVSSDSVVTSEVPSRVAVVPSQSSVVESVLPADLAPSIVKMDATQKAIFGATKKMNLNKALSILLQLESNGVRDPELFTELARRYGQQGNARLVGEYKNKAKELKPPASPLKKKVH